ncbi:putative sperm motility kinase W [Mastomys coucha]|uniref:putative sperm motility kinase W n=1 Tax=Mastomys coucha TaxID=35658 RepID=UPI0012617C8F|nr:putative sperm motility kinase W [Mastomys coucha]
MDSTSKVIKLGSQYRVVFYLDKGSFGTVKLAWHLKTQALVAIKMVEISKKTMSNIHSERAALEKLNHPNIIRLFQVIVTPSFVNFVLEYCPQGSLFDLIHHHGPLQEKEAKRTFGQIVAAVKYLHNCDIIHRDIKPNNILKDAEGNMKLIDFGLSVKCQPGRLLKRKCGTKVFYAPECVLGQLYDGRKTDIWSLGVLLYFITTGYYPFEGKTMKEIENNITTGTYRIPCHFSGTLENLIHQILTVPPEMRSSIEDIERHPWVMKCQVTIPTDTYPDYSIIDILCDMGFNANEILESLQKKRFDENMGTYLLLKEQIRKGVKYTSTTSAKPPVDQYPAPPPSPAHTSTSGLPPKRRASEPNFGLLHIWPSGQQGPVTLTPSGHKVTRSVSMPSIALHCPKKNNITSSWTLNTGAVAAPSVCSNILEDQICLPPEEDIAMETPSPPLRIGFFKRLRKRIRNCLSRLCCFPRAPETRTQHIPSKKVAPLKEARCKI